MEEKTITGNGPARKRLEFTYDHLSRRVRKLVRSAEGAATNVVSTNWPVTKDRRFIYDGWNMIAEIDASITDGTLALFRSYAWGNDLSGTPQGAGGVGGLLMIQERDLRRRNQGLQITPPAVYAPCTDLKGNILAYIEINRGEGLTHSFEYDAFGKELTADSLVPTGNGTAKENIPFRFSTKYHDDETGLAYYGYRFYNPESGRWLNRDPIAEQGGLNLYGFVINNPLNKIDNLGLEIPTDMMISDRRTCIDDNRPCGSLVKTYVFTNATSPGWEFNYQHFLMENTLLYHSFVKLQDGSEIRAWGGTALEFVMEYHTIYVNDAPFQRGEEKGSSCPKFNQCMKSKMAAFTLNSGTMGPCNNCHNVIDWISECGAIVR
jgi:RHS repeat-associated protein